MFGYRYMCTVPGCVWQSKLWPQKDMAGCEATWHVYEEHHDEWVEIAGDRPPADPDPRKTLAPWIGG